MRRLINKQYRTYNKLSRYATVPFYYDKLNNKYVYGTSTYLNDTTAYSIYEVKRGDTLDKLALYFYNNPTYFWIICSFNRIQDPYEELKIGEKLKIPTMSVIEFNEWGKEIMIWQITIIFLIMVPH